MHPPFSWTSELEDFARATALAAGFHLASVADVEFVPGGAASLDGERFAAWVEAGRAGEMEYLKRRDAVGTVGNPLCAQLQLWRAGFARSGVPDLGLDRPLCLERPQRFSKLSDERRNRQSTFCSSRFT